MRENPANQTHTMARCLEQLRASGFEIREQAGERYLIYRDGCATVLELSDAGAPNVAVQPGLLVAGSQGEETIAHLADRGFQKFWQDEARQRPARSDELKSLHQFQRDLRAALGVTTLYNEALGSV